VDFIPMMSMLTSKRRNSTLYADFAIAKVAQLSVMTKPQSALRGNFSLSLQSGAEIFLLTNWYPAD
jgi:hypothetical protein